MLTIRPIRAFRDNYIWCLSAHDSDEAVVVDPGDAGPVLQALADWQLRLTGILVTHHHPDHTGGIDELLRYHEVPVFGPAGPGIPQVTEALADGDRFRLLGLDFRVLAVPGHTLDHLAFVVDASHPPLLFCGDTLFAAGCGRLFEGSPAQMQASLQQLAALPADTAVYCAHEYTLANLQFATAVEPDTTALRQRLADAEARRANDHPTLPSSIGLERQTNPFFTV